MLLKKFFPSLLLAGLCRHDSAWRHALVREDTHQGALREDTHQGALREDMHHGAVCEDTHQGAVREDTVYILHVQPIKTIIYYLLNYYLKEAFSHVTVSNKGDVSTSPFFFPSNVVDDAVAKKI